MDSSTNKSIAAGCLSHIGLFTIIGLGTLPIFALTLVVPPWVKVDCQRRQIIFTSMQTRVYKKSFAGFDYVFSSDKWERIGPKNRKPGTYFDCTEYHVHWWVLVGEWFTLY